VFVGEILSEEALLFWKWEERKTLRETTIGVDIKEFPRYSFDILCCFLYRSTPLVSRESRENGIFIANILAHSVQLGEWYEEYIIFSILDAHVFSVVFTDSFFDDFRENTHSVIPVDDVISGTYFEEEIKIF